MPLNYVYFLQRYLQHGYKIQKAVKDKPYKLNIVGWRNKVGRVDRFDDFIGVYWQEDDTWYERIFPASTRPGLPWLLNPISKLGTAILVPGQYINAYGLGDYRGYTALKQKREFRVFRDKNRDSVFNCDLGSIEEGNFGMHLHRAGLFSKVVGLSSAGCQVVEKASDFNELIELCKKAVPVWGNRFTYTLLEF